MHDGTLDFYDKNDQAYAAATLKIKLPGLWESALRHMPPDAHILDLGCGSGRDIDYFSSRFDHVYGLDRSFNLARFAYQYALKPVVQADLRHLPFQDRSFDVIWSIAALLHLRKSHLRSALQESKRVLRLHGCLFISLKMGQGERIADDGRFFAYYSERELRHLLTTVGFKMVAVLLTDEKRHDKQTNRTVTIPWIFTVSQKISAA
jgi:ubiquinone/menaquinone biosynthesis C-methylase UbiE